MSKQTQQVSNKMMTSSLTTVYYFKSQGALAVKRNNLTVQFTKYSQPLKAKGNKRSVNWDFKKENKMHTYARSK